MGSRIMMSGWMPPTRRSSITVCCTVTNRATTSVTRAASRTVTAARRHVEGPYSRTDTYRRWARSASGSRVTDSWVAVVPLLVRDHRGHRDAPGEVGVGQPAGDEDLARRQGRVGRDQAGGEGLAGPVAADHRQLVDPRAVAHADLGLPVGDQAHGGRGVVGLHHLAHQAARARPPAC